GDVEGRFERPGARDARAQRVPRIISLRSRACETSKAVRRRRGRAGSARSESGPRRLASHEHGMGVPLLPGMPTCEGSPTGGLYYGARGLRASLPPARRALSCLLGSGGCRYSPDAGRTDVRNSSPNVP
ncbi:unnamed protein product, partial [Ixodes persulcatus]